MTKIKIINLKALSILLCSLLMSVSLSASELKSDAQAIAAAVQQRTLSQQMLKYYILSGLGVRSRKADQALQASIGQFEHNQQQLLAYVVDNNSRQQINQLEQSWQQIKPQYQVRPAKQQLLALYAANDQLLDQTEQLIQVLQQSNHSEAGVLIDLSGRQQMHCAQLSALYGMMAWGYENQARSSYLAVYERFTETLTALNGAPENTPLISHSIKALERQIARVKATAEASQETYIPGLFDRSIAKVSAKVNELEQEYLVLSRSIDG